MTDKNHALTDDPDDNDDELELEPIDPEIFTHQQKHIERQSREAEASVDIDQLHRAAEKSEPLDLEELENFRFTTRHLLIVTALLSIVLTLCEITGYCTGLFLSVVLAIAGGYYFVHHREQRHAKEMDRRRRELEQQFAARRAGEEGKPLENSMGTISVDADAAWGAANREASTLRFSFSLKEFSGAFTVAAVVLALLSWITPGQLALMLGLTALLGLIVHGVGYDPPRVIILGWWLLLVLYLILGLWAAFSPEQPTTANLGRAAILKIAEFPPASQLSKLFHNNPIQPCFAGGELRGERFELVTENLADGEIAVPFSVGRNNVPGCCDCVAVGQSIFVSTLIVVPQFALG